MSRQSSRGQGNRYNTRYSGQNDPYYDDGTGYYDTRNDGGPYSAYGDEPDGYYDDGYEDSYDSYGEDPYEEPARRKVNTQRSSSGRRSGSSGRKSRPASGRRTARRRRSGGGPVLILVLLLIVLAGAFGMKVYLDRYSYSKERESLEDYFSIADAGDVPIVWNNAVSDVRAKLIDGTYYLDLDTVQEQLNSRFYYGVQNDSDTTGMILYCLPTDKLSVQLGSSDVVSSSGTDTKEYVPAVKDGDTVYLALPFVKEYTNFTWQSFTDPDRLEITTSWDPITTASISRDTQLRTSGGIKSPILEDLSEGAQVTVLEQMDNWSKVQSADAVIGYVENKRLTDVQQTEQTKPTDYQEPEFTRHLHETTGKINMAFHAVYGIGGNDTVWADTANTKDVNVLAPTWFWVSDNDGNFTSAARQDYVDYAHSQNMEVWAVVDNFNSTDLPDHNTFLHTLDARTNLITQLMTQVDTFGLDGINVDFEQIEASNGQNYIEFIRELSIACRNKGITLSVDDYVPYEYNDFYDMEEQGVFADYVVVMGYDEHTNGSAEAGSVASIGYVTDGIKYAAEKVEKSRIINAVPFYSRIWFTKGSQLTCEAYGMQDIQNYIQENNMTETWNAEAGQNYAEMTRDDGTFVQIWIEDPQSIKEKLDVMQAAGIGGVAEWKLEFDIPAVWDVIADYMEE